MDFPSYTPAQDLRVREVARFEKAANSVSSDKLTREDQTVEIKVFKSSLKVVLGHLVKLHGRCVRLFCCTRIRRQHCAGAVRIGKGG